MPGTDLPASAALFGRGKEVFVDGHKTSLLISYCDRPVKIAVSQVRGTSWFAALVLAICAVAYAHAQQIGATDLLRGLADPSRWLMYSGDYTSKRHSPLTQITPGNVARLTPVWAFEAGLGFGRSAKFEATPIAID